MSSDPTLGAGPVVPIVYFASESLADTDPQTVFGVFDSDADFVDFAPKVALYVAKSLGYPVVTVELEYASITANFEVATMKFASIVNEFLARENMLTYQGMSSTAFTFSQTFIKSTPIPYVVTISDDYGMEAEVGGNVDVKAGYIVMHNNVQEYDLQNLWAAASESGNRLEIRRVFHDRTPAMQRFFDPFAGTGTDMSSLLGAFGWNGFAVASNFLIMPIYETLLRVQEIELNDQIRRSEFSFTIRNNKLQLFPVPSADDEGMFVWFEYMVVNDKFVLSGSEGSDRAQTDLVSDYGNIPFTFVPFSDINDPGRYWIFQYTLAMSKIVLGNIRSKYETLPIPNSEVRLDGTTLRQEGQTEMENLEKYLRDTLTQTGKEAQMEKNNKNEENANRMLARIPLPIYIF